LSPFQIPNEATAAFPDQAEPDSVDVDVLVAAFGLSGVVTGCAVTAQGTPDNTVAVASGKVVVNATVVVTVASGNLTIAAGDAANPRFDLVVVNNAGVKSVVQGTAAANPVFPAIPANSVVLAAIYVPANDTTIEAGQIVDKRTVLNEVALFTETGMAEERVIESLSDYMLFYDASAGGLRRIPAGHAATNLGRQFLAIFDDMFFISATGVYAGGVSQTVTGTGAASSAGTGDRNHPGVVQLSTGTTATGRCGMMAMGALAAVRLGGGRLRVGIALKIDVLSVLAERYILRLGLGDLNTGEPTDGVYFRYSDTLSAGDWEGVCRANGVETVLDTNTPANTGWHYFEFEVNAAGTSVEFFIDGVSKGTISTNIPIAAGRETTLMPANVIKSLGTTARTFQLDSYSYIFEFDTAR
jgi:hypothetical protein